MPCKDTPNFIANRIGSFFGATVAKTMLEGDYTIEEVDALTGPLIGLPNSASFRLLDIVGLDVWAFVGRNLFEAIPHDPWRDRFLPTDFQNKMLERKWLGEKTGQGFYKRVGKGEDRQIWVIDWKTLEYHPLGKVSWPSVEAARNIEDLPERLRTLVRSNDRAGSFLWHVFSELFLYAAEMIPEISDRIVEIDRAMRWGYANKLGPFELWDALGFEAVIDRMEAERRYLPANVKEMLAAGARSFYDVPHGSSLVSYFDLQAHLYKPLEERPGIIILSDLKRQNREIRSNAGASLIDLGDGVLCVEFHSKMNALGEDNIGMLYAGMEETSREFRRDGDRQRRRKLQRRRESDAGAASRAGGRVGRIESSRASLSAGQHGAQVRGEASGVRAVRAHAGWRLRDRAALDARAGLRRNVHRAGRGGRGADTGRRRMQGTAGALERPAQGVRADRLREGFQQRRRRQERSACCTGAMRSP